MQKKTNEIYAAIHLASQSMSIHSASIAEQILYYFLRQGNNDISLQELETFSADHRITVNDCFSVMSWLVNTNIIVKKLYDRQTGLPVLLTPGLKSSHPDVSDMVKGKHSAEDPTKKITVSKRANMQVRWALNNVL